MRGNKFITFIYVISLSHFFPSLLTPFSASLKLFTFRSRGEIMSTIDPQAVAQRIDTVLDILVAGDYHSAIRNLEILKSELLAQNGADSAPENKQPKAPWEV
jgi:hypothetical protein